MRGVCGRAARTSRPDQQGIGINLMAKKLDPLLKDVLVGYGEDPTPGGGAIWDCHGTWVVYHKAIERIAARAGVTFELPQIIEANTAAKTVAIAVRGTMGE